jgi:hypothetical protein
MKVCRDFNDNVKKILELGSFAAYKVGYVLGCLASKLVWKKREWMDQVKLLNEYDNVYKKGFYYTGYDLLEFDKDNEKVFCIETKSKYRPMIWNIRLFGDPDKYLLRLQCLAISNDEETAVPGLS